MMTVFKRAGKNVIMKQFPLEAIMPLQCCTRLKHLKHVHSAKHLGNVDPAMLQASRCDVIAKKITTTILPISALMQKATSIAEESKVFVFMQTSNDCSGG